MENGNCIFKTYFYAFEFHVKPEHANKPHLRLLVEIEGTIAYSKEVWAGGEVLFWEMPFQDSEQNYFKNPQQYQTKRKVLPLYFELH